MQGGLTTTMELTAAGRPFLYFPLRHHFEQNFHVPHRLDRYGAGQPHGLRDATPTWSPPPSPRRSVATSPTGPVQTDGAADVRGMVAELL